MTTPAPSATSAPAPGTALARTGAAALVAGPLVFLTLEAVSAWAWDYPAYSYARNWISDLGVPDPGTFQGRVIDSPLAWLMNTGFVLGGLALLLGVVAVTRAVAPRRTRVAALGLGVAAGIGYVLVGLTHTSTAAAADGTIVLHFAGASLAILGGNTLALVLGVHWRRRPGTRALGRTAALLGVLGLVAAATLLVTATSTSAPNGLVERVSVYTLLLFEIRTGLHLAARTTTGRSSTGDA
ncbi:hypothetical protein GCM10022197_15940 [Microlunatus spumicola]|uniref:DUF998 domain-containing protein n=1 Tax=Microlunatus spumicola TaxID=81499 RepID=A0ABP6X6B9_9ACTN